MDDMAVTNSLNIQGHCYIGTKKYGVANEAQVATNAAAIAALDQQLTVAGSVLIDTDLYMNSAKSIKIQTTNGNSVTTSAEIKFGHYSNENLSGAGIELTGYINCLYGETIWIGQPNKTSTYINGRTQLNLFGGDIWVQETNGAAAITLEDYVAKKGGFNLIKIESGDKVTTSTRVGYANNLVTDISGTMTVTLAAPSAAGTSGQILSSTGAGTSWIDIVKVPTFPTSASKYLRTVYVPSSTSYTLEWGDIPSPDLSNYVTTAALSSASVSYATSAGSAGSATNATNATYATYVVASEGNASSNGYGSYVAGINGTGNRTVYYTGLKVSTISTTSSRRFKHNIEPIEDSSLLYKLKPVSFIYNNDESERIRYGFIAEDILPLNKHLVDVEKNGEINALYYNSIFTLAIAEIQKLRKELNELKASL